MSETVAEIASALSQGARGPNTPDKLLVRRPADPAKFNGTVVVEWLNVSGQLELSPDYWFTRDELLRKGYAWVGVSAQSVGVNGGLGEIKGLKGWDNGDFTGDNVIDAQDYLVIDSAFVRQQGQSLSPAFLSTRANQFGDRYITSLIAAIPEPASLLTVALSVLIPRRSRRNRAR